MAKRFLNGIVTGAGFVAVLAVAFAIAWAGDVFTIDKDGALKFAVSDAGKITVGATESYVNLVIQNDEVAAEADNKVDITADVLTVEGIRLESVNVSANIESGGAGGLDAGTETIDPANTTWYYIWVITNNDGSARNGLLSLSSTSPTLPAGYTRKRRVGAVGNTAVAGNFLQFVQEGGRVCYPNGISNYRVLSAAAATDWTTVQAGKYVPLTSRVAQISLAGSVTHDTAGSYFQLGVRQAGSGATDGQITVILRPSVANVTFSNGTNGTVALDGNRQMEFKFSAAASGGYGAYIDILGYCDRI